MKQIIADSRYVIYCANSNETNYSRLTVRYLLCK